MSRQHTPPAEAALATPAELPLYLTVEAAARELSLGRTHAWRLVNAGVIPTIRLSPRCIRVPRSALEDLRATLMQGTRGTQAEPVQLRKRVG